MGQDAPSPIEHRRKSELGRGKVIAECLGRLVRVDRAKNFLGGGWMLLLPLGAVALPECALVVPQRVSARCRSSLGWNGHVGAFSSGRLSPAVAPQGLLAPEAASASSTGGKERGKSKHIDCFVAGTSAKAWSGSLSSC